jgi:hypothetical protein
MSGMSVSILREMSQFLRPRKLSATQIETESYAVGFDWSGKWRTSSPAISQLDHSLQMQISDAAAGTVTQISVGDYSAQQTPESSSMAYPHYPCNSTV